MAENSSNIFHNPLHFHIMSSALVSVLAALNTGRTQRAGAVAVHASSKGYRITWNGHTVAKGSTPDELHQEFSKSREDAKKGT